VGFLKILPMAIVMIAGPQILSAIFLATTASWQRNSAAYLAGAALSITAFVSLRGLRRHRALRDLVVGRSRDQPPAPELVHQGRVDVRAHPSSSSSVGGTLSPHRIFHPAGGL
jgi:hypothetical protein